VDALNLAIFDLDGTLLDTNAVDSGCFVAAWRDELGIDCSDAEWSSFAHVTDGGIAEELLTRAGIGDREDALRRVQRRFIQLLERAAAADAAAFRPIRGARELIGHLPRVGWHVAVATGAWKASAEVKLRAAGMTGVPLAACDGAASREEIVRRAIENAPAQCGCRVHARVVLIGDAPWDVRTARRLSLPFVGVGAQRERLIEAGATEVLADFGDIDDVLAALRRA
jgi:phosphoglycolate phosphatase-like HAD superfamily hydrolase